MARQSRVYKGMTRREEWHEKVDGKEVEEGWIEHDIKTLLGSM